MYAIIFSAAYIYTSLIIGTHKIVGIDQVFQEYNFLGYFPWASKTFRNILDNIVIYK